MGQRALFAAAKATAYKAPYSMGAVTSTDPVLLASDAIWFYYNLDHLAAIPTYTCDAAAYVQAMKRMTTLVPNRDLIIPGHDAKVFEKFPRVADGVVRIW